MEDNLIKIDYDNIDVENIMKQIRENIRKRNYPLDVLNKLEKDLDTSYSEGDFNLSELEKHVSFNNVRWNIQKTSPIRSNRKIIGPFIVIGKRIIRKLSYWYIQFLTDQQNDFNASVTNSINEIEKYIKKSETAMSETSAIFKENIKNLQEDNIALSEKMKNLEEERENLNEKVRNLEEVKDNLNEKVDSLNIGVENLHEKIGCMDEIIVTLKAMIKAEEENKRQYSALLSKMEGKKRVEEVTASRLRRIERHIHNGNDEIVNIPMPEIQTSGSIDMDYFLFEEKYRGSREEIKERQKIYLEYFINKRQVLDIGCGRGEFVELLSENNVGVLGIDIDTDNVNYCADKGLPVRLVDALEYLHGCEDSSLDGIFMAQVAEHLKPNDLISLLRLARRKLQAGAYFIVETINPQSLIVFTESYYMDPSHIKMVHPLTLKFLAETEGFSDIHIKYLSPVAEEHKLPRIECSGDFKNLEDFNEAISRLNGLIYGCRDYALVAKR